MIVTCGNGRQNGCAERLLTRWHEAAVISHFSWSNHGCRLACLFLVELIPGNRIKMRRFHLRSIQTKRRFKSQDSIRLSCVFLGQGRGLQRGRDGGSGVIFCFMLSLIRETRQVVTFSKAFFLAGRIGSLPPGMMPASTRRGNNEGD